MRITFFLTDTREIKKIMDSLGIPEPEPPNKVPVNKQSDQFDTLIDATYDEF